MYKNDSDLINGIVQGANNAVKQIFHLGYEAITNIAYFIQYLIPPSVQNDASLQEDRYRMERLKIAKEQLKEQLRTNAFNEEYKKKEIKIQELRNHIFEQVLNSIQKYHEENVQLKLQELQAKWDVYHSVLGLSPKDTQKFFQRTDIFWILLSPPKIQNDLPEFRSLGTKIDYRIDTALRTYYSETPDFYPIGYRQIFKKPIETRLQAADVRNFLYPVPTLILSSVVTEDEVYMTLTLPIPVASYDNGSINDKQILLQVWNWKEIRVSLESIGKNRTDSIKGVKELIAIIHVILAIYFCDIYCLNINPSHEPKFFDFLQDSDFPEDFQKWVEPYKTSLQEIQESLRTKPPSNNNIDFSEIISRQYISLFLIFVAIIFLLGMCSSILSYNSPELSGVVKVSNSHYNGVVLGSIPIWQ